MKPLDYILEKMTQAWDVFVELNMFIFVLAICLSSVALIALLLEEARAVML